MKNMNLKIIFLEILISLKKDLFLYSSATFLKFCFISGINCFYLSCVFLSHLKYKKLPYITADSLSPRFQ